MINIDEKIELVEKEFTNRIIEINYMYTKLFNSIDVYKRHSESETVTITDIYFIARSVTVFTYATMEKFVKKVTEVVLEVILECQYFNNNYVKELMQILKCNDDSKKLFELLMYNKGIYIYESGFEIRKDRGYFSRSSRIDSETIAYIIKVLNLNKEFPFINLPKITIDTIARNRMDLAHGDYIDELNKFGPGRNDLTIEKIEGYIEHHMRINEQSKDDLINFFTQFKEKNTEKLEEIKSYMNM